MIIKTLKFFQDITVFILIFSFFNDNYITEVFGEDVLKITFGIFILLNIYPIVSNLSNKKVRKNLRYFFFFLTALMFIELIHLANNNSVDFFINSSQIVAVFVICIFFSRYDLQKVLYISWICIVFSIFLAYQSDPITQWTFRRTGGVNDPNEFSAQLLYFLIISIFLFAINKSKIFLSLSLIIGLYGLLIAASLSAVIILPILTCLMLFRYVVGNNIKKIVTSVTILIFFSLVIINYYDTLERIDLLSNILSRTGNTGTLENRIATWESGLNMFSDKPTIGVGMNNYSNFSSRYASGYLDIGSLSPHNIYLKILSESGIFVFILFIIFLFFSVREFLKKYYNTKYILIGFAFLSYLLFGLTLGITYDKYFWLAFSNILYLNINEKN